MSYQVLARKWRPRSFATLVGQEHVVRALSHALDQNRLHHAYLFTGTRGVGKTTLARILAKALNCETGVSSNPCGTCSACQEIDAGRFVDLLEVDAATNTKVEQMRELLESASYAPTRGRYKIFVIDEVHMLSNSAFNAMLKTLEEPPEHIKFVLATTDPQKIPVTVLSRCLQFNLKQMPPQHIIEHLGRVLEAEQVPFEPGALRLLAKGAAGSMRDALSLLDQAIAHGAGRVEEEAVRAMLGTVGEDHLYAVLDGLLAKDIHAMLAVARAMDERSLSFDSALQELGTLLHRIALAQFAPEAIADDAERARLGPYVDGLDPEFLQLAYQIVIQGRADLPLAPDEAAGFSMCLLRLAAFRPETPSALGATPAADGGAPRRSTDSPRPHPAEPAQATAAAPVPASRGEPRAPLDPRSSILDPRHAAPRAAPSSESIDWRQLVADLKLGGMVRELAQHCVWLGVADGTVRLRLAPAHKSLLMNRSAQDKLQAELAQHFRQPLRLAIDIAEIEGETPAQQLRSEQQERHERAVEALEQDGFVRDMIDLFDATLNESSVKPL
jgi:DNA polymerase-3 subunit gamma/tau